MIEIRLLRFYKEIIDQGNISKAAEELQVAQPYLSMSLKQLEEHYGTTLVHRYRQKWEITEAGRFLYDYASEILNKSKELENSMEMLKKGDRGFIRIGISTSCMHLIIQTIRQYQKQYPKVKIHILNGDSAQVEQMLRDNQIDVACIINPESQENYHKLMLPPSNFYLAVPKSWENKLAWHELNWVEIVKYPIIMLSQMVGYSMRRGIDYYFKDKNLCLNSIECRDFLIAEYFVVNQVGISILPVSEKSKNEKILYYAIPDLNVQIKPVVLYKKEIPLTNACKNFVSLFT